MSPRRLRGEDTHTYLAIRVDGFDAEVETGLNIDLMVSHSVWTTDEDLVFPSSARLQLRGHSTYPEERAGEAYEISVRGESSARTQLTFKDVHTRNEHHAPVYRRYRGRDVPVYKIPPGMATLERRRKDRVWRAWINDKPRLVTDMLILTRLERPLFLAIHEIKFERRRWIRSISLQTTDPAEE